MPNINIENLCFSRGKKIIFDDISLNIKESKITAIMGPSGCGKTTLLKLIGKQLDFDSGSIKINNKNLLSLTHKEILNIRKKTGILFQSGALFSDLNVYENIAFPVRENTNLSEDLIKDIVLMKLQSVGLSGTHYLMPSELSVGMSKRVALARAIVLDPDLIMYDEPFAGQDPISMSVLMRLIELLNKTLKITTIIVSHDVHETMSIADYIYIINEKKIVAEGSYNDIKNNTDDFVQVFINRKFNYDNILQTSDRNYENDLFYNT
jgi:phospholipid/cholesterol/gamma-HCH transport system ATP-binding protein